MINMLSNKTSLNLNCKQQMEGINVVKILQCLLETASCQNMHSDLNFDHISALWLSIAFKFGLTFISKNKQQLPYDLEISSDNTKFLAQNKQRLSNNYQSLE